MPPLLRTCGAASVEVESADDVTLAACAPGAAVLHAPINASRPARLLSPRIATRRYTSRRLVGGGSEGGTEDQHATSATRALLHAAQPEFTMLRCSTRVRGRGATRMALTEELLRGAAQRDLGTIRAALGRRDDLVKAPFKRIRYRRNLEIFLFGGREKRRFLRMSVPRVGASPITRPKPRRSSPF